MRHLLTALLLVCAFAGFVDAQPPPPPTNIDPEGELDMPLSPPVGFGAGALGNLNDYLVRTVFCNATGSGSLRQHIEYVAWLRGYEITHGQPPRGVLLNFHHTCDTTYTEILPVIPRWTAINGKGSTVRGTPIRVENADHVFIQNIRVYDSPFDGFTVLNSDHVYLMRVTALRATDGSIDITRSRDVTVHFAFMGDPVVTPTRASTNMLIADPDDCLTTTRRAPERISLILNLYTRAGGRNPLVQVDNCGTPASDTTVDMVNNLVANWSSTAPDPEVAGQGTVVRDSAEVNIRNGYYTNPHVPPGNVQRQRNGIFVCDTSTTPCPDDDPGFAYVSGNLLGDQPTYDFGVEGTETTPFPVPSVAVMSPCAAAALVKSKAGAWGRSADETALLNDIQLNGC